MTESNVKQFRASFPERQHQRKIVMKDEEASRQKTTLCISDSIQDGTCFENYDVFFIAKETTVRRKLSILRGPVAAALPGSPRGSLFGRDTSSSELEHSKPTSGAMDLSANDLARTDL